MKAGSGRDKTGDNPVGENADPLRGVAIPCVQTSLDIVETRLL